MVSWMGVHLQIAASCGMPFGLFLSLSCTGGWLCRSLWPLFLFISFSLWGILSWPGFYMPEPQLYNQCSHRQYTVCVCLIARRPSKHLEIWGKLSQDEGVRNGGDGVRRVWWVLFQGQMINVKQDNRRRFWLSSCFSQREMAELLSFSDSLWFCH